jgi:UDP-N-acetylmuramyl pentapeptide synthase
LGFCVDSRQIQRGQVFVAIKTDKRDGHDFIPAAAAAGAAGAIVAVADASSALPQLVVDDPLAAFQAIAREHRRAFPGRVIGISGSAGKTSTKDLLALLLGGETCGVPATEENLGRDRCGDGLGSVAAVASAAATSTKCRAGSPHPAVPESATGATAGCGDPAQQGRVLATEGHLNNHLGVPLTLTRIDPARHDFAVVEAGISAPDEMAPLADMIEPDVSIITLIAPAHTEELGGIDGVAREKAVLPAATRAAGVALFSRETSEYEPFRDLGVRAMVIERADVLRPAEPPKDTVYFTVTQRADETAVALAYGPPPPRNFVFRRVSDGMAQNAVLAICAALWLGVSPEVIQQRLRHWKPARLGGVFRRVSGRLLFLVCYNANPSSMADALTVFDALATRDLPRLYVIGCMEELGDDAAAYHRSLGETLELRAGDRAFVIGANASDVRAGAIQSGVNADQIEIVASTAIVADVVQQWRGAVFVKGSRKYQLEKVLEQSAAANAREPSVSASH